ncbi:MAG TPA: hypothetical protein VMH28_34350 [Candidatus Acidoferrales bacterium]|nr:hypothetical protein [Candidatus Acidoferrales bacterium]
MRRVSRPALSLRYPEVVTLARLLLAGALLAAAAEMALIQPPELVSRLSAKPAIFQVGPNVLYRSKHIPASVYAGPGSKLEGLTLLKSAVAKLPHDREIVLYCGCCPWDRCPNVKPSIDLLKEMGFTNVKALYLPDNFKTNWIDKGYPIE